MDQSTNEEGPQRSGSVKRARENAAAEDRKRREQYEMEYEGQPSPLHVRRREERQRELEVQQRRQQPQRVQQQMGYGPRTNMIQPQPQQQHQQQQQQHQGQQPSQVLQGGQMWPLSAPLQIDRGNQQRQPPQHNAPGRPVMGQQQVHPSLRQAPHVQEHSAQVINGPSHDESHSREAESYLDETSISSSMLATPGSGTGVSRESQAPSTGIVPEFPASAPVKPTGLGPPPSARRGPESFYSVNSAVMPVVEESPRVPAFDPTTSYLADKTPEESGRKEQSPTFFDAGLSDEDDFHIEQPIVRSASMGRKGRPTMVSHHNRNSVQTQEGGVLGKTRALLGAGMINGARSKSAEKSQFEKAVQQKVVSPPMSTIPTIVHPAYREREPRWPTFGGDDSPIENKDLDSMSSDSESTLTQQTPTPGEHEMKKLAPAAVLANARSHLTPSPSHSFNRLDGEKDGNVGTPEIQYNRNSAIRRPPKLNLNAVRDAEARGSLTSLPDLIRRATKLASMMNEGKRPESRLNDLNSFSMEGSEKGSLAPGNRASGLSGMLAAFPPPGANGTPLATPRSGSHWPVYASSTKALRTPQAESHPQPRRRCCGMPLWCFVLCLLVLLCVIAVAVVVPLKLVVFKDKEAKQQEKVTSAIESCQRDAACQNGGTSVISGSACSCICANGYDGARCDRLGTQGCTTVNYFGTESGERFEKITVGNAIPRLVDGSDVKYSIPLFWEELVTQFGKGEVSCSQGNSLVSFNGGTGAEEEAVSSTTKAVSSSEVSTTAAPTSTPTGGSGDGGLDKRQVDVDTNIALATGTATAANIKPAGEATSVITSPSTTATGTTKTGGSSNSGNITISADTLDFARVAVLYVVQERSVSEALQAQGGLINCLKGAEDVTESKNGTIRADQGMFAWTNANGGTGFVDLASWTVGLGGEGGKKVGGRGEAGRRTF